MATKKRETLTAIKRQKSSILNKGFLRFHKALLGPMTASRCWRRTIHVGPPVKGQNDTHPCYAVKEKTISEKDSSKRLAKRKKNEVIHERLQN